MNSQEVKEMTAAAIRKIKKVGGASVYRKFLELDLDGQTKTIRAVIKHMRCCEKTDMPVKQRCLLDIVEMVREGTTPYENMDISIPPGMHESTGIGNLTHEHRSQGSSRRLYELRKLQSSNLAPGNHFVVA